ncbi:MAG: hypothetical protein JSV49_09365 [Thermoplasmata archaeon]|nr:MAG: hypothetical protein JSV49_09365 [Thermoplasmata archaeon]
MEEKFICPKCKGKKSKTHEIATTGSGLSRLYNVQYNEFIIIFCLGCGYTEIYNKGVLFGRDAARDVVDAIFG